MVPVAVRVVASLLLAALLNNIHHKGHIPYNNYILAALLTIIHVLYII